MPYLLLATTVIHRDRPTHTSIRDGVVKTVSRSQSWSSLSPAGGNTSSPRRNPTTRVAGGNQRSRIRAVVSRRLGTVNSTNRYPGGERSWAPGFTGSRKGEHVGVVSATGRPSRRARVRRTSRSVTHPITERPSSPKTGRPSRPKRTRSVSASSIVSSGSRVPGGRP